MAVEEERLAVLIEARVRDFERKIAAATRSADRNFKKIETSAQRMQKTVSGVGAAAVGFGRAFAAGLVPAITLQAFGRLSDAATRVDNALKVAGLSGEELESVYNRLRDSAVKNAAPLETLVTLFGRASLVQKELNVTQEEMLNFTDKIALALRVSGQSAAESSGALLQLSQALGAGTVRAEEFNSILEGALPIAQAAAAGLEEAGGSVAKLRQLVVDGKVSSEAFFRAFEAGSVTLEDKVAGSTLTVSQASGNLWTSLVDVTREFNNSTGAAESFAGGLDNAAQAITNFDVTGLVQKIRDARNELRDLLQEFGNAEIWKSLNEATGTADGDGNVINPDVSAAETKIAGLEREIELLQQRIELNTELGMDNQGALSRLGEVRAELAKLRTEAANLPALVSYTIGESGLEQRPAGNFSVPFNPLTGVPPDLRTVKTRSLKEFAVPGGAGKGAGGSRGGGGGGENDFAREVQQMEERAEALKAETAALAGINPLLEDYGFAVEQARAKQELLTAAKKAGITVTPELGQKIDALAATYAMASAEADKLAESQDKTRQAAEDMRDLGRDSLGGFIRDLRAGKSASEALAGALDKVSDRLLDIALDGLFDSKGGGGGFLGNIFGGLFGGGFKANTTLGDFLKIGYSSGTANTGGTRGKPAGVVHGQEAVIPLPSGGKVPVQLSAPNLASLPLRAPDLSAYRQRDTEIRYVEVPVLVESTTSDDGRLVHMMRRVSGEVFESSSPKIVAKSVAAVGKRARMTKSFLGG